MSFSWIKFYNEMFLKIVNEYDSRSLAKVAYEIFPEKAMMDRDAAGKEFRLEEFEPCTFMARFNRKERDESRIAYCKKAKQVLGISSDVPKDFAGIPIFQNMAYWFFPFKSVRKGHEFNALWAFARDLVKGEVSDKSFNAALESPGTGLAYLTTICFIVRPDKYLPLDRRTKQFLNSRDPSIAALVEGWRNLENPGAAYRSVLDKVRSAIPGKSFSEISLAAYEETLEEEASGTVAAIDAEVSDGRSSAGVTYWVAGAAWKGDDVPDKTAEFIRDGVWRNGYGEDSGDKSVDNVKLAKPGDFIAIKSSSTKGPGRKVSFLKVKALGVITENLGDGVNLKVNWKYKGPEFDVDNITYRRTFQPVGVEKFIKLIFGPILGDAPASIHDRKVAGGSMFDMSRPRNVIYWGPPGTGKTYQIIQLQSHFEDSEESGSSDQIVRWVQEATWWEVIAAAMIDLKKSVSVPELFEHEFIQIKSKQSATKTPKNTIWGTLQSHTISGSKTVNFERRQEPLVVDKSEDSKWHLVNNWEEQLEDLVEEVKRLRASRPGGVSRRFEMVTFHQSYSYEEFVEGIRPESSEDGSSIRYDVRPGVFRRICQRALENPEKDYAIFIDEINRGNISKIFGELITLIEPDKRLGAKHEVTVTLPYSGIEFGVPENVHIIGTMNSVDRSIALVDMALRRRFQFIAVRPDKSLVNSDSISGLDLKNVFSRLNEKIATLLGSEYQIGHSYFMGDRANSVEALKSTWFGSILPLLQEYLFDDWSKMKALVGDFVIENQVSGLEDVAVAKAVYGTFVEESISDEKFIELMRTLG